MLHIFCNGFFQAFFRCFYKCFRRMSQVFQLFRTYVAKFLFGCFKSRSGVASLSSSSAASHRCLLLFSMLVMFGRRGWSELFEWCGTQVGGAGGTERRELRLDAGLGPDIRALACPLNITQVRGKGYALFVWLISRIFQPTNNIFFSHNKSANSTFSHDFLA
jgi:hypothetical protein